MRENFLSDNSVKEIYIRENAIEGAVDHCIRYGDLEAIGLLLGRRYMFSGKEYILIEEHIEAKSRSSHTFVELDEDAYSHIGRILRSESHQEDFLVGWYHSHPSFGCWLSGTDIETQATYFYEKYHCALVIDPIGGYLTFFKLQEGNKSYREVDFCVVFKDQWLSRRCYNGKEGYRFR